MHFFRNGLSRNSLCLTRTVLDCEQSLFSQSSLSSAGLERAKWPRGKLERGFAGGLQLSIKFLTQTTYAIYRAVIQSFLTACVQFRRYVAKLSLNSTANGSSGSWNSLNFFALKIGGTVTYCLIIIVSLVANSLIVTIVCKTPNLKKPINYFIANMASSDLLYPIFVIPRRLSNLHTNYSFLIGGQLGQALCKLVPFFSNVSIVVLTHNLILIAVVRFGAVVFRTPFATHQIQAVSLLHSCHVDSCRSYIFAILVRQRAHGIPREKLMCYEMEESIRRVIVPYQFATSLHHYVYIHPCAVVNRSLLHHCYQAQDTGTPR